MNNIPASIYVPSMLLKHLVKCTFHQRLSVLFALPQSSCDQWGVHSSSFTEQVVLPRLGLILTTFLSFKPLQSVSASTPYPVEHLHLQFWWHASNSLQQNTVSMHHAFSSQYHSVDLQVYLKTATLSGNTCQRVNGILASLWHEVWFQFSLSLQPTSQRCFTYLSIRLNKYPITS